jgi:hypothetical protein
VYSITLVRKELYLHLRSRKTFGELLKGLLCWFLSQSKTYTKRVIDEGIAEKTILHAKTVEL